METTVTEANQRHSSAPPAETSFPSAKQPRAAFSPFSFPGNDLKQLPLLCLFQMEAKMRKASAALLVSDGG